MVGSLGQPASRNASSSKAAETAADPHSKHQPLTDSLLPPPRLDYRGITENSVFKSHNAFNRRAQVPVGVTASISRLYGEHKEALQALNASRAEQAAVGLRVKAARDDVIRKAAIEDAKTLKAHVHALFSKAEELEAELLSLALLLPNDTHTETPIGPESAATIRSTHGPEPLPANPLRDHVHIGKTLDLFDLESGATVSGSSWYFLRNEGALLELALTNYAMSLALRRGFTPMTTPDVVKADIAQRCGFQPRDPSGGSPSQNYYLEREGGQQELVLAGTAEIPLAGSFANKLYEENQLPIKVAGLGRAFRAEAGARGADTRGLYRVHQFSKVELFSVTRQAESEAMMEELGALQCEIFEGLGIPFRQGGLFFDQDVFLISLYHRILEMPTEELGASAFRKIDMEAWMPGRGGWGEVCACANRIHHASNRHTTDIFNIKLHRLSIKTTAYPLQTHSEYQGLSPLCPYTQWNGSGDSTADCSIIREWGSDPRSKGSWNRSSVGFEAILDWCRVVHSEFQVTGDKVNTIFKLRSVS